jgi:hypothetical protein
MSRPLVFFSICAVVDFARLHQVAFDYGWGCCHSLWPTIDCFAFFVFRAFAKG